MRTIFLGLAMLATLCRLSHAQSVEHIRQLDISGMALFDSNMFVVVHDTKAKSDEARMGMLHIRDDEPPAYVTIEADWGKKKERPNDFEAVCMLKGRPNELLAVESKYHDGGYGRIFHIQLRRGKLTWEARIKGTIPLPENTVNLEGIQTVPLGDDRYILLLGERGGEDDKPQGEIRWGTIDLRQRKLNMTGSVAFDAPDWTPAEKNRDISDLYIDKENGLWIASSDDPGNNGPFRSVIYYAGTVSGDPQNPVQLYGAQKKWELDGLKVEALGPPVVPQSTLSFGTDDEDYGGIWRPLY